MQGWLSRGATARIGSGFHCVRFIPGKLFEDCVFTSVSRGADPAFAKVER